MSVPIKACLVIRAASGDEDAYEKLVRAMKYNIECGHYTSYPCDCNPRCDCTDEELEALDKRIKKDLKGVNPQMPEGITGEPGEPGMS